MSDTLDTKNVVDENTSTPKDGEVKKVEMTQEQLDNLINKKYATGAEKAKAELLNELGVENVDTLKEVLDAKKQQDEANKSELEKLQEQLQTINSEKESLANQYETFKKKAEIERLAFKNGIDDVEYFEFKYNKASSNENFNADEFINEFKGAGNGIKKAPQTDKTPNNDKAPSISEMAQQARELAAQGKHAEAKKILDKLY